MATKTQAELKRRAMLKLEDLTDEDIRAMRQHELIERLHAPNPLAGYTGRYGADLSKMALVATLKRYRDARYDRKQPKMPERMSALAGVIAQLASDGIPEPVALLTIARRAIDAAGEQIATYEHPRAKHVYRSLGTIAGAIITQRDELDAVLSQVKP